MADIQLLKCLINIIKRIRIFVELTLTSGRPFWTMLFCELTVFSNHKYLACSVIENTTMNGRHLAFKMSYYGYENKM